MSVSVALLFAMGTPSPSSVSTDQAERQPEREDAPDVKKEGEQEEEEEEEEELMFPFESEEPEESLHAPPAMFRSISDFHPLSRPSNPLAAVLAREGEAEREDAPPASFRSFDRRVFDFNGRHKRKASEAPAVLMVTPVVRPVPKRARLDRSATAPPSFMRAPSPAGQPLSRSSSNEACKECDELGDASSFRPLSASIAIPASTFRPIRPAGSSLADSNHSSASSSKSWTGSFCRRSLDVSSPVRSRLADLVISSSASRTASFDGS